MTALLIIGDSTARMLVKDAVEVYCGTHHRAWNWHNFTQGESASVGFRCESHRAPFFAVAHLHTFGVSGTEPYWFCAPSRGLVFGCELFQTKFQHNTSSMCSACDSVRGVRAFRDALPKHIDVALLLKSNLWDVGRLAFTSTARLPTPSAFADAYTTNMTALTRALIQASGATSMTWMTTTTPVENFFWTALSNRHLVAPYGFSCDVLVNSSSNPYIHAANLAIRTAHAAASTALVKVGLFDEERLFRHFRPKSTLLRDETHMTPQRYQECAQHLVQALNRSVS